MKLELYFERVGAGRFTVTVQSNDVLTHSIFVDDKENVECFLKDFGERLQAYLEAKHANRSPA
mgnify:CR=1 FL=1|jgi:hypothetical protein